jgi:hypothetical protein
MVTAAVPARNPTEVIPKKTIAADASEPMRPRSQVIDTTKWLTRVQVMDMLKVSHHKILYWEQTNRLHGQRVIRADDSGAQRKLVVYDPHEVAKLPQRANGYLVSEGEIAARAFELFDAGKTDREVVVEIRETPDKVCELREKWMTAGGSELVLSPAAKDALEAKIGPFESVAELVARIASSKPGPDKPE